MSMKPILFSTEMVKALLDGRKSMTRRIIKPQPTMYDFGNHESLAWQKPNVATGYEAVGVERVIETPSYLRCPYGEPGDILWVRETWADLRGMGFGNDPHTDKPFNFSYKADIKDGSESDRARKDYGVKWKSSRYMPRKAARLFLLVKDVRVERLQEIGNQDARKEGFESCVANGGHMGTAEEMEPRKVFAEYWDILNVKSDYPWSANPYVWVISFERTERPVAP